MKRLPPTEQCLWSRAASYTWRDTHQHACRYSSFLLDHGVQPNTLVAFYLQNSPDFVFALLGAWAVGSSPALINYNLGGQGLVHCLKISGATVLLVDADEGCRQRIEEMRSEIEGALGMTIVVVDEQTKREIAAREATRPEDRYRDGVKPTDPMCLMYTRYARSSLLYAFFPSRGVLAQSSCVSGLEHIPAPGRLPPWLFLALVPRALLTACPVDLPAFPRPVLSRSAAHLPSRTPA